MSPARKRSIVGIAVSSGLMKQFWACQPRPAKSASTSLTPAWIFSAVMPGGKAGSEKSTVAGSKPTNRTRFIDPPRPVVLSASDGVQAGRKEPPRAWESETEIQWKEPLVAPCDGYRERGLHALPTPASSFPGAWERAWCDEGCERIH